jgi:hypothetical protein
LGERPRRMISSLLIANAVSLKRLLANRSGLLRRGV